MVVTVLVFGLVLLATVTDVLHHKIYNWTTYTGMLAALALNAAAAIVPESSVPADNSTAELQRWVGWVGLEESLLGLLACGFAMVVCYVFFRIGGGDVKLMAMLGAFLGFEQGIAALLWTFVIGGAVGLAMLIWRVGAWRLVCGAGRQALASIKLGGWAPVEFDDQRHLRARLFLAPSALAALVIVHLPPTGWL